MLTTPISEILMIVTDHYFQNALSIKTIKLVTFSARHTKSVHRIEINAESVDIKAYVTDSVLPICAISK